VRFVAAAIALALIVPAASASARGVETARCANQSEAGFPGAFDSPESLVVGPLSFVLLQHIREVTMDEIRLFGGVKSPALVRPGHTVKVSIDRPARSFARLAYVHVRGRDSEDFDAHPHTVRFKACDRDRAESNVDGRPVTFWSGFFLLRKSPACLPVTIRVDRRPARHRDLSVGGADCS
jgi:hypothetical protein